ncbi:uncharacterized protein LOC131223612 isoform X2 [Magnolia sinica]|uniref:uncharacterized protein LOC131223612 isoform X2 n=1 Tax=Magnolia sinica TaxID=86752 RepID=UPI0026586B38|nr:uncharacterized protein LOC131223612 isoform X2 [Magnolia sinica]XP_058075042.1 uncharacterized protein LOC131223612 isoform X2 [Magnolia sinica]
MCQVRQFEEGLKGSWHSGVVIGYEKSNRIIEYTNLLTEDGSSKLIESITVSPIVEGLNAPGNAKYYRGNIRPSPPDSSIQVSELCYKLCVDAFVDDAWWEGLIFDREEGSEERLVFFPDQGDQQRINVNHLRITQDWDEVSGNWCPRGNWFFLELLEKIELEGSLPVSVRQIWYDVRTSVGFSHGILEWTCGERSLWSKLVLEAIQENINAALGLALSATDFVAEEDFAVPKSKKRRKINKSQVSASGADLGDQTEASSLQRLDECIHQHKQACKPPLAFLSEFHAAPLKPALDCRSEDAVVLHMEDHLSERIGDSYQERENGRNFHPAAREDDTSEAVNRGTHGKCASQGVVCQGLVGNRLISKQKKGHQTLSDFLLACRNDAFGLTRSKVRLEAKQLLLSAGWVFGSAQCNPCRMHYDSPSGQRFYSFAKACKAWQEEKEAGAVQDTMNGHGGENNHIHDDGGVAAGINSSFSENKAPKALKTKRSWQCWGRELLSRAKFSSQAVIDYCALHSAEKKPDRKKVKVSASDKACASLKAKLHLLALGWKIEYRESDICIRIRYISPSGKRYDHLMKACVDSMQQDVNGQNSKNDDVTVAKFLPKPVYVSQGPPRRSPRIEKMKLREEQSSYALDSFSANQDSRNIGMHQGEVRGSRNDHGIVAKVNPEQTYFSQGPLQRSTQLEKIKFREEQSSCAVDLFSANQDSMNNGMCRDVSLLSNEIILIPDGGSISSAGRLFSPETLEEQQHKGDCFPLCRENLKIRLTKPNDLQAVRKNSKCGLKKRKHEQVRTVLSWLIDNGAVCPKQKVFYMNNEDRHVMAEGRITLKGIRCKCCKKVYGLTGFAVHAGGTNDKSAANIFLKDGKSLLQCQTQLVRGKKLKSLRQDPCVRIKSDYSHYKSDDICSICHYGGKLILCDHCPSSFHLSCIGLKGVPEGRWSCPSCQCGICGQSEFNSDIKQFTSETILYCDQCDCQYHVGCLRKTRLANLGSCPQGNWFCSKKCSQIFVHLQKLLGKSNSTAVEGLSWTILRSRRGNDPDLDTSDIEAMTAQHSKLYVALSVLHECFVPFIEPRTEKDFFTSVLFNRGSKLNRLNFRGFYTLLLERGDEVVSVATVRIFGEKVAEIPLIGTCVKYRRRGMCRLLMTEVEKVLSTLGVERLLVPAVPELLETWTNSFGFTKMTRSNKLNLSEYNFLDFQDTIMCQKLLVKYTTTKTLESREDKSQDGSSSKSNEEMDHEGCNSISEVIEPILPSEDVQVYLLHGEAGTCEELSTYSSLGSDYCPGPAVLIQEAEQIEQSKTMQPVSIGVGASEGSNICGFIEMAPPVVKNEKKTTAIGFEPYVTRAVARR